MSNVVEWLRTASALRAALYQYERASDAHRRRETELLMAGEERAAELHARAERIALRAWQGEMDDRA